MNPVCNYTTRTTCRVCGSEKLTPLFSLGNQYVSDFVPEDKVHAGHQCPIDIEMCADCTLVQAKHTAPQDFLYTRHYWYRSGVTQTMRDALKDIVDTAVSVVGGLEPGDIVLDIGSNDGTLLRNYVGHGVVKVGVEPASNLEHVGKIGVDVFINDFWDSRKYFNHVIGFKNGIGPFKAKIITACGMFYDLEDPNQFIADIAETLHPNGVFIAQLMCLKNMLSTWDLGNFAHEHLEFFSLKSLQKLFDQWGLELYDLTTNKVNGESYRLFVRHKRSSAFSDISPHVQQAIESEEQYARPIYYYNFRQHMEENRSRCVNFIRDKAAYGKKIWVYGASTKGNVILQWYGLGYPLIQGAADRSPEKHGKYTIGTGIPIYSEEYAREQNPDYFLVLPYAFLEEFIEREHVWRMKGGKFIIPLPNFRIV